jgi:hypothetical protein
MKSLLSILLVGLLFAVGCTERIPRSHLKARSFELNLRAIRGPVTVDNVGGRPETVVEHFSILGDSAMWIEPESNTAFSVPTMNLKTFTMKDRISGGLWGLTIGTIVGLVVGGIIDDGESGAATAVSGTLGYLGGFGIGMMIGVNTDYVIEP